jgi:hypothetical protein
VPVPPSWLIEPLWDQFSALLPERPRYHPDHPLRCHRPRIDDRIVFDKLLQLLLLAPSLDRLDELGPLPEDITVHLDAGYDSDKTRALLSERGPHCSIAWRAAVSGGSVAGRAASSVMTFPCGDPGRLADVAHRDGGGATLEEQAHCRCAEGRAGLGLLAFPEPRSCCLHWRPGPFRNV